MIQVNHCVIHEIIKEPKNDEEQTEVSIDYSEALLDNDNETVKKLLLNIHKAFGDSNNLKNTQFAKKESTRFSSELLEYLIDSSEEKFLNFSKNATEDLKGRIEKINFAVGGYYVFADYSYNSRRFQSVMVIRKNKDAISLKKIGNVHQPSDTENVNTEKISMGFRLNYEYFLSNEPDKNYIALVTSKQDSELSGYFKKWVNAAGVISNEKNSLSLVKIIKGIKLPINDDTGVAYSRDEFQKLAYEFIDSNVSKIVNLKSVSSHFYGESASDFITNYAAENNIVIDNEFRRNISVLKRLISIKAKAEGVELNVDIDRLNPLEVDVKENDGIIIIHSRELISQILLQQNEKQPK